MKRITSLLTLFIYISAAALAQFHNPVNIQATQKKVSDDVLEVVFQGSVDAGWHVYGTDIADGGPTRAELTLETQKGVKPDGKLRATGKVQKAMDEIFGIEVSYMEGTASFVQRFTITEPEYEVAGYLTYGACNDENCIPPTNVEFSFKGTASPKSSPKGEDLQKAEPSETSNISEPSPSPDNSENSEISDNSENSELSESPEPSVGGVGEALWAPVVDELKAFESSALGGAEDGGSRSLWSIFLLGVLGGLIALLTPCVWPIIPMTVSTS